MTLKGACSCGKCEALAEGAVHLTELVPRVCDCDYCQMHPSAVVSHPNMLVSINSKTASIYTAVNGSGQATFYHCEHCDQLLAVGALFAGVSLGAVNAFLFGDIAQFAVPISIQPRLLSPAEKIARWPRIWGPLNISGVSGDL